jgi:hypothetical protein
MCLRNWIASYRIVCSGVGLSGGGALEASLRLSLVWRLRKLSAASLADWKI